MDDKEDNKDDEGIFIEVPSSNIHCSSSYSDLLEVDETSPLLIPSRSPQPGSLPRSWSGNVGMHPYTRENRPNRRPFHLSRERISREQDSELYARFKYYSRLRAPATSTEHALLIPDHVIPSDLFIPYIPGQTKDSDGKQSSFITVIAIWNTMMGTSLLTMPWAFGQAGFAGGFLIMICMAVICLYTAYRLLTLQNLMGLGGEAHELAYLCRTLWRGSLGKAIEGIAVTFSVATLLGALIVYWVLMSNFLFNSGEAIFQAINGHFENSTDVFDTELVCPTNKTADSLEMFLSNGSDISLGGFHRFWRLDLTVPLYLLIPFMFLLNIRNPAIFTYFNSLGAVSVLAMYLFVIIKASSWGFNYSLSDVTSPLYIPLFKKTFMALSGTLSLAYFIHNAVITITKGNRHPENNVRDVALAYLLVALTYIPIGVLFYLSFPLPKFCIADNFLDNFPPHNVVLAIIRGFLLFQMLTVYPLLTLFVRSQLFSFFFGPDHQANFLQITLINVILLAICVLVAIFYPNIGFIIRWVGAFAGLVYVFILPCISYLQAMFLKKELTWKVTVPHMLLILVGFGNFASQFFL